MTVNPELAEIHDDDDAWFAAELEDAMLAHERRGEERGRVAGFREGIEQGIEQGIQQGIEQGIERGIERGIEQGIEQGIRQGLARSAEAQRETLLRLAAAACAPEVVAALERIADLTELEARVLEALRR